MEAVHHYWLNGNPTSLAHFDGITGEINAAIAANPFTGLTGYDPADDIEAMADAILAFQTINTAIDPTEDYILLSNAAKNQIDNIYVGDESYINARGEAHARALDLELETKVIPRFEAGMRDINAVNTSAFVIGRAIIELDRNDKVDKFISDMRYQADVKRFDMIQNATGEMVRLMLQKTEFNRAIMATTIDQLRLAIAAQQDFKTETKAIAGDEGRWPLECYKYGANLLAGIGGGTTGSVPVDGNKTARIIGSGLSGASAGAMIGNAIGGNEGAGWGAIVGGLAGMLMGS
ncbi:MAG: hypothetical protein BWY21_00554 [Parcubacteria group bacterium ADurb.Bin216]|nr:MAG: hypothetical protein BWY21_00554 [Parcubacteria group bacterium ADurb.Bin216]